MPDKSKSHLAQKFLQAIARSKELLHRAQVTRATVYGVLGSCWGVLAGPVTMILITRHFTPEVQGYYYTFSSVLALNIFFELGFSNIVKFFAGHEWAKLSLGQQGRIIGDSDAYSRLVSLGRVSFRWYLMGGIIVALGIGGAGYIFFSRSPNTAVLWVAPWLVLSILSGVNMALIPVWSILEGCNQVSQVYFFRMVGAVLVTIATWTSMCLGVGLWTASISTTCLLVWSAVFIFRRYSRFFQSFLSRPTGPVVSWWGEIWRVQWRSAVGYLSGYFTAYVFTPILFHFHGPVVAGKFGMSWGIAGALAGVALMWSTPRGPQFAVMIANRDYKKLDQILFRIMAITVAILLSAALIAWLVVYGLNVINHPFAVRVLPPLPMALLLIGVMVANSLHPMSVYLRAHKREPYMAISVAGGILTGLLAMILGLDLGRWGQQ